MHPYILSIPSYSLMIVLGLIVINLIGFVTVKRAKLQFDDFALLECWMVLGAVIGSKILYLLTVLDKIELSRLADQEYLSALLNSGFVFYGGVIGAFIALFPASRIHHIDFRPYIKSQLFLIPLAHGIGRIGCFLAGCCYGIPYSGPFSVTFPENSFGLAGVPLFPLQLVEAMLLFSISIVLYFCFCRKGRSGGVIFYAITYAVLRFVLEFFRGDGVRGSIYGLSTSQWISISIFILFSSALIWKKTMRIQIIK